MSKKTWEDIIAKAEADRKAYEEFRKAAIRLEKDQNMDEDERFGIPSLNEAEKIFEASAKTDEDYKALEAAFIRSNARTTRQSAIAHGEDPDATPVIEYSWRRDMEEWRQQYAQRPKPV